MAGPYDSLIGALTPGQFGWLIVDASGVPTAAVATLAQPAIGTAESVPVKASITPLNGQDALVTPTGASLRAGMVIMPEIRYDPTGA